MFDPKFILTGNCLEHMRVMPDKSIDIFFTDPPYALGSEVIIRPDGKPDYKKAVDFMNKWEQPDGAFWEEWFQQAFRILKYGGRVVMFGMDRQLMLNKYYACAAGFTEQQSLYWYFIQNFPKASDLSVNIDKNAGAEREVVGKKTDRNATPKISMKGGKLIGEDRPMIDLSDITAPNTDLAKKYEGYKYSISPLKQTCENIMVFQRPYKTGSALHDVLAYENGDKECLCGAMNIDGSRVPFEDTKNAATNPKYRFEAGLKQPPKQKEGKATSFSSSNKDQNTDGRYPSQTFIDSGIAGVLSKQSGNLKSGAMTKPYVYINNGAAYGKPSGSTKSIHDSSEGDCSKILHKCDYDKGEYDLYIYCPKVSKSERNEGCKSLKQKKVAYGNQQTAQLKRGEELTYNAGVGDGGVISPQHNDHPTPKPLALITQLLKLFKTPNPQVICDPFAGTGTTGIVCDDLDIEYILIELKPEFIEIASAKVKHHRYKPRQTTMF